MIHFIESLGDSVIRYSIRTYDLIVFIFHCIGKIFLPSSYTNSSINFLVKQIYLSGVKPLFSFIFLALVLGSLLIVLAIVFSINFSLQEQIGDLLVLFVINEFSPLFTAIFFIFSYTLSTQEKIQSMKNKDIDLVSEVYIPKIISTIFMTPLMSLFFASIMIASGYVVSSFYLNIDFFTYKNLIISSISFNNIIVILLKGIVFGFISIIIPIYFGHKEEKSEFAITQLVIKTLVIILSMLVITEFLFILVIYWYLGKKWFMID